MIFLNISMYITEERIKKSIVLWQIWSNFFGWNFHFSKTIGLQTTKNWNLIMCSSFINIVQVAFLQKVLKISKLVLNSNYHFQNIRFTKNQIRDKIYSVEEQNHRYLNLIVFNTYKRHYLVSSTSISLIHISDHI